jgi:RNA-directed DNA polymerase
MCGHYNDVGVTDNSRARYGFEHAVRKLLVKWLNRRSERRSFSWESFRRYEAGYPLLRPVPLLSMRWI